MQKSADYALHFIAAFLLLGTMPALALDTDLKPPPSHLATKSSVAAWDNIRQLRQQNRFNAAIDASQALLPDLQVADNSVSPLFKMWAFTLVAELAQEAANPQLLRRIYKQRAAWAKTLPPNWADAPVPQGLSQAEAHLAKASLSYLLNLPTTQTMQWLEKAAATEPEIPVQIHYASMLIYIGEADKAEAVLRGAIKLPADNAYQQAKLLTQYGYLLYSLGRVDEAKKTLTMAMNHQHVLPFGLTFMHAQYLLRAIEKIHQDQPNYISELNDVPQQSLTPYKVRRWHNKTRVISVLIPDGSQVPGWQARYETWILWALDTWNKALDNRFQFEYSKDPKQPYDLQVVWKPKSLPQPFYNMKNIPPWLMDTAQTETLGQNLIMETGNYYLQNRLDIFLASSDGHSRPDNQMKHVILHEIGHSFGITGHSRYPGDVMFESSTGIESNHLSTRDIQTIKQLYADNAAVTNEPSQPVSLYAKRYGQDFNLNWAVNSK